MKPLFFSLFVLFAGAANATNYYVSATGNDGNRGTTAAAAWKTIAKVNSFSFAANDSILFKRGEVFYGAIVVNRSNVYYSAYGTGANPIVSGFTTVNNWTSVGGGIYECAVNAKSNLNMVTINGRPQQIGRYPNADDANGGYLTYQNATTYSITDNTLSTGVNWTGAQVAIRKNPYIIERDIITNHTGGTITYRMRKGYNSGLAPILVPAVPGHGYFFMNDPRTLDQFGEWYYDTTAKKILVYFGAATPSDYSVKVSTIDTLFSMGDKTYVNLSNVSFEGANMSAVYSMNGGFITVRQSDITNIGGKAVQIFNSGDVLLDGVHTANVLCNAIEVTNSIKPNAIVRNCVLRNTSPFAGMGSWYEGSDYKGMCVIASSNVLIEYNVVDSVGLSGIVFNGNDVIVQKNVVNHFCYRLQDNGGIYTFAGGTDANPGKYYTNRIIRNNIVMNGIGAPLGTNGSTPLLSGIYLDGRTMNVSVLDNTVFNCAKNGIGSNNPNNITIRGNTLYNNKRDISFMRWAFGSITNLNIKQNISFPLTAAQKNIYYTNGGLNTPVPNTLQNALRTLGSIDSNYYNTYNDAGFAVELYDTEGGAPISTSPYSLDGWRALTNYDLHSKRPAQKIIPYTLINTVGGNLFINPQFTSNINGTTLYGSNTTAAWDNTAKVTGQGSLRVNFSSPQPGRYCLLHSPVGMVSNSKKYILRFTTVGTSVNGILRTYIRKTASPYTNLTEYQTQSFGVSKSKHEFLFDAPITDVGSFVIEVEQASGTTYIDDVEFYEANATINTIETQVRFEYNTTNEVKNIMLDGKYIGVDSTVYNGTLALQPFSSRIIIKAGPVDSIPVVDAGEDMIVSLPIDSVQLNGRATGGTIVSYKWTKLAGPAQFTITNATKANAALSNIIAGMYTFQLRVTNSAGLSATDTLSVIASGVLPVVLLDFSARKNNDKVQLEWQTSTEINTSHYMIQRSTDGRQFQNLGRVVSNNNGNRTSAYSFVDASPVNDANYYRLAIVDRDGSITYSRMVLINIRINKVFSVENVLLSGSSIKITVNSDKQQVMNLRIVDVAGRIVTAKQLQLQYGFNNLSIAAPAINKGVYYVQLFTAAEMITKTILSE